MKRRSMSFLALLLVASMAISPLSCTKTYAAETAEVLEPGEASQDEGSGTSADSTETPESTSAENQNAGENENTGNTTSENNENADNAEGAKGDENKDSANAEQNSMDSPSDISAQTDADIPAVLDATETPVKPTAAITGLKVLKNDGTGYGMFPTADAVYAVRGDKIEISFNTGAKKVFDWLYLGPQTDSDKSGYYVGKKTGSTCQFTIQVPLSQKNSWIPVAVGRSDKGTWSENYLWMSIPNVPTLTQQPQSVNCKDGETVSLSVAADGNGITYQWQYSLDGTTWSDCAGGSAQTAAYTFTMTGSLAGQYRCVITDSNGTSVTSQSAAVGELSAPTVTGSAVRVVKQDGDNFKMFVVGESKVIKDGDNLEVTISTANTSFDKLYLGSKDDVLKTPAITGTELSLGGCTFSFTVPISYAGQVHPIALGKPDGSWYSGQYLWIYIPDEGIQDIPTVSDEIKAVQGGTGSAHQDFKIVSSRAVLKNSQVVMTLDVKGNKWTKLYQGVQRDSNKTPVYSGSYDSETDLTTFTVPVPAEKQGMNIAVTPGNDSGWFSYARDLFINVPNLEGNAHTTANGVYNLYGSAFPVSNYASLNFERESSVTINGDTATVTLITQASSYDKIYIGSVSDEDVKKDADAAVAVDRTDIGAAYKSFTFTIPTADLGKEIDYVVHLKKENKWAEKQSSFYINGILEKTGELTDPTPGPTPDLAGGVPEDGTYSIEVYTGASMFKVVKAVLTVKDGKMSAVVTLSGQGYDYLYMGTASDAQTDKDAWIPAVKAADGTYTYAVPVESLDKALVAASHSSSKDQWYDRTMTFKSETIKKISDSTGGGDSGTNGGSGSGDNSGSSTVLKPNDGKADSESKYEADMNGSTGRVNSSTTLADGVYTPDAFTWSGGTGKVKIYCNKVTITNGQAYATLVFDSEHYQYVKANGNIYYTTKGSGRATVVIPVALNKNNRILAMTTKMSNVHEIEYTIFVYLAGAGNGKGAMSTTNKRLDEEAPDIMGLQYESETKLDYAEYFKIYHYDQSITLLEVDTSKDTARDPQKLEEDETGTADMADEEQTDNLAEEQAAMSDEAEKAAATAEDGEVTVSQVEMAAELYKGNVVKYLLVPEGVEVPVGLEQDMIVVQMPVDKAYVSDDAILETMDELGLSEYVSAVGSKKKDCKIASIAQKMEKKDGEEKAEVVYGGTWEDPNFKELVKQETNLALFPAELLPKETEEQELTVEEQTERFEEITEKFALLGIPIIIDRSEDEKTNLAKYEWVKVYGVLFGCEEEMDEIFEAAVAEAGDDAVSQARAQAADQTAK